MLPADFSTLASSLSESEAAPVLRHALLSLAAASDRSNVTHMSLSRLSQRLGVSRNYLQRSILQGQAAMSKYCSIEEVPGRASRWVFQPDNWRPAAADTGSAGAAGGVNTYRAGAAGGQRRRCRGAAPALHVSSTTSGHSSSGQPPTDPKGSPAGLSPELAEQERQLLIRLRQLREQQQEADKRPLRTGLAEEGGR